MKIDLQHLQQIETWPRYLRLAIPVLVFLLVLGIGQIVLVDDISSEVDNLLAQETSLKDSLALKQMQANLLPQYQNQVQKINANLDSLSAFLPAIAPTSEVLDDISKAGEAAGVNFGLIKPKAEVSRDSYVEIPIDLSVTGTYQQLGAFMAGLNTISRIVNVQDFTITHVESSQSAEQLLMHMQVMAYRISQGASHAAP